MSEINVAKLYEDIGSLKKGGEERTKQVDKLFELVEKLPTKDEIGAIVAEHLSAHTKDFGLDDLHDRVLELEADRRVIKTAIGVSVGAPPVIAAMIEIGRWLMNRH